MAIIRQQQQDIVTLLEYMEDTQSGMEICQQRINAEMAKIDAIIQRGSTATVTPTTTTTASAPITTATPAAAHVGPLTLTANSPFDPNDYRCRECSQMFVPLDGGYWLIGPNIETGDTFYLCRDCTQFMEAEETPQTLQTQSAQRIDEEEEDYSYDSEDYDDEPKQGDYDHSEECS